MNFNSVIKFFLPKDKVFYVLFEKVSDTLVDMATLLIETVKEEDIEKRRELSKRVKSLEHLNDETTHKIFVELGQNFVTPFDREDIHTLASTLDDIADYIHGTTKKMWLYRFFEVDETILDLSDVIYKSTIEIKKAVHELRSMSNLDVISEACVRVNSLENEADDIYDSAVAQLFADKVEPRRIIILKDILHSTEAAADKCEDVANVIESIILKYA